MLEIIYRIYEVYEPQIQKESDSHTFGFYPDDGKCVISQEVLICENRKQFKDILTEMYSEEPLPLKFAASRKYAHGQKYCIIIGEQCYDTENYTTIVKCKCDSCGVDFMTLPKHIHKISDYTIRNDLGADFEKYNGLKYCSNHCERNGIEKAIHDYRANNEFSEEFDGWVSPQNLTIGKAGYVYKITKRSTGEFYAGQSIYCPVFRWGQHLKTSRFPLSDIEDYVFEVLESVENVKLLNEREKHWIQKLYRECPEKSLNIMLTTGLEQSVL